MNKNTQHTPGPWYVDFESATATVRDHKNKSIARCYQGDDDARLIAAAPNLLAELKGLLEVFTAYIETEDVANGDIVEAVRDARAAIAEAQGGAE